MQYIFSKHYIIPTMQSTVDKIHRALLYEPKFELAGLYFKYLSSPELEVQICSNLENLERVSVEFRPHLLIYNIEGGYTRLKNLKSLNPSVLLITLAEDIGDAQLSDLMALGASAHINRKVTSPKDVGILARQLLQY